MRRRFKQVVITAHSPCLKRVNHCASACRFARQSRGRHPLRGPFGQMLMEEMAKERTQPSYTVSKHIHTYQGPLGTSEGFRGTFQGF